MRHIPYLVKRADHYYFRIAIPLHLAQNMGRKEILQSLKTKDYAEAVIKGNSSPFSDLNLNLWKTFDIWFSYAEKNDPSCNHTTFTLVTNSSVSKDALVNFLRESGRDIDAFLEGADALQSESKEVQAKLKHLLQKTNRETFIRILEKTTLVDAKENPNDIFSEIKKHVGVPSDADEDKFIEAILGWFSTKILNKIIAQEPLLITRKEYNQAYAGAVVSFKNVKVIGADGYDIEADDETQERHKDAIYIKQLAKIDITKPDVVRDAMLDYLRFLHTKNKTIESGEVLEKDWNLDAIRLKDHWQSTSQMLTRQADPNIPNIKIGQSVFDHCRIYNGLPLLNGNEREAFVIRGHYHVLADGEQIWWNPDWHEVKDK